MLQLRKALLLQITLALLVVTMVALVIPYRSDDEHEPASNEEAEILVKELGADKSKAKKQVRGLRSLMKKISQGIPDCQKVGSEVEFLNDKFDPPVPIFLRQGQNVNASLAKLLPSGKGVFFESLPIGLEADQDGTLRGVPKSVQQIHRYPVLIFSIQKNGICVSNRASFYMGVYKKGAIDPSVNTRYKLTRAFGGLGNSKGRLSLPYGSEFVKDGDNEFFYLTDCSINTVYKYSDQGNLLSTIGWGAGTHTMMFNTPADIKADHLGRILIVEERNHRVQVFDSSHRFLFAFGAYGRAGGDPRTDNGYFNNPLGIATNSSGKVYVSDYGHHRIQIFSEEGYFLGKFGRRGKGAGEFEGPYYLETDSNDNLFVVDRGNNRIQKFTHDGKFLRMWGREDAKAGSAPGEFNFPHEIAIDNDDNFYVADALNQRIQIFNAKGDLSYVFGQKLLFNPKTIAVDSRGRIFVGSRSEDAIVTVWDRHEGRLAKAANSEKQELISRGAETERTSIYEDICTTCHSSGAGGAPKVSAIEDWNGRSFDISVLLPSVIIGSGAMPARGGCVDCSEEELKIALEDMLSVVQGNK